METPHENIPEHLAPYTPFLSLLSGKAKKKVLSLRETAAQQQIIQLASTIQTGIEQEFQGLNTNAKKILASKIINYFHEGAEKTPEGGLYAETYYIQLITDSIREVGKENFFTQRGAFPISECITAHNKKRTIDLPERFSTDVGEVIHNNLVYEDPEGNEHVCQLVRATEPGHLQRAGEYASVHRHVCIGDSVQSYIHKLNQPTEKNGIEVYFLWEDNGTEGGMYHQIITYGKRSKRIEQMRGVDDLPVQMESSYLPALVKALSIVRQEKGPVKSIANTAHLQVPDYQVITSEGIQNIFDISSTEKTFILKAGRFPHIEKCTKEEIAHIVSIFSSKNVTSAEIAVSEKEITKHTKLYIGPFTKDVFSKLPFDALIFEHFPEDEIERITLNQIGGQDGATVLRLLVEEVEEKGLQEGEAKNIYRDARHVYVQEDGNENEEFKMTRLPQRQDVHLVRLSVKSVMGKDFWQHNQYVHMDELFARMQELGLCFCPPEVGAHLLLQKKITDWTLVGMKPVASNGDVALLHCFIMNGAPVLSTFPGVSNFQFSPEVSFVFRIGNDSK